VTDLLSSFSNLYVDEDDILYSLPNCSVFDIRGKYSVVFLCDVEENQLLVALSSISRTGSFLDAMYVQYLSYARSVVRGVVPKTLKQFIHQFFKNSNSIRIGVDKSESREDIASDTQILKRKDYITSLISHTEAIIYSQKFISLYPLSYSLHMLSLKRPCPLVRHVDGTYTLNYSRCFFN
jgi:hypothetical protein